MYLQAGSCAPVGSAADMHARTSRTSLPGMTLASRSFWRRSGGRSRIGANEGARLLCFSGTRRSTWPGSSSAAASTRSRCQAPPPLRSATCSRAARRRGVTTIFSVDVLGEGVDVPSVDTVLLLRPTDSATVFTQQLGRGLRRSDGKSYLTVIDLMGSSTVSSVSAPAQPTGRSASRALAAPDRGRLPVPALGAHVESTDRASRSFLATFVMRLGTLSGSRWSPICVTYRTCRLVDLEETGRSPADLHRRPDYSSSAYAGSTRDRCCNHGR